MEDTKKKALIVVAILVVVGVGGYFLLSNQSVQEALQPSDQEGEQSDERGSGEDREVSEETRNLIEDAQRRAGEEDADPRNVVTWQEEGEGTSTVATGVRVADGSSPINTETGEVMTDEGERADNSAEPGTPGAPGQSFITDSDNAPEGTIKMSITPNSIDPEEFTVSPGEAVSIAVTAAGDATEIFRFDDPSLQGVAVGVAPGKTRIIPFNAPDEAGEYTYYSDVANHRASGAEGVMIVE